MRQFDSLTFNRGSPRSIDLRRNRQMAARILRMANLNLVVKQLQQERNRLSSQMEALNQAISLLGGVSSNGARRGRGISAAGRARIAAAQKARWAKIKGRKSVSAASLSKRTITAAARRKIAAAQKARWAKWRKAQKTA